MSGERRPDWETLNAYVDGELPAREAAAVAAAVAADAGLAAEVDALRRLKRRLARLPGAQESAGRRRAPRPLLAAAVVAALAVVIALLAPTPQGERLGAQLVQAHAAWSPDDAALRAVSDLPAGVFVPDLTAAGLELAAVRRLALPDGRSAIQLGYLGSRGCRVSLFAAPARGAAAALASPNGRVDLRHWQAGPLRYVLAVSGMASDRHRMLLETLREASRAHAQPDPATRLALARSRARSAPCVG
ncbi:hypothetical protein [Sediminicurvatus halobius]|uniref:Zinc-finger domain-containing protein n=1 Tax=Sediminicurvatus halobius TaxID=2182432 RepID=A0A2U2MXV3_9GAMM|nr:hypothetical protein [Spiribacter halobius]PWG61569.1 hypothetical protein DEM34_15810 [Spiribacter halobius]UEX77137.1 hypothetical protein LMH63_14445 [Spiribacter halobius]